MWVKKDSKALIFRKASPSRGNVDNNKPWHKEWKNGQSKQLRPGGPELTSTWLAKENQDCQEEGIIVGESERTTKNSVEHQQMVSSKRLAMECQQPGASRGEAKRDRIRQETHSGKKRRDQELFHCLFYVEDYGEKNNSQVDNCKFIPTWSRATPPADRVDFCPGKDPGGAGESIRVSHKKVKMTEPGQGGRRDLGVTD